MSNKCSDSGHILRRANPHTLETTSGAYDLSTCPFSNSSSISTSYLTALLASIEEATEPFPADDDRILEDHVSRVWEEVTESRHLSSNSCRTSVVPDEMYCITTPLTQPHYKTFAWTANRTNDGVKCQVTQSHVTQKDSNPLLSNDIITQKDGRNEVSSSTGLLSKHSSLACLLCSRAHNHSEYGWTVKSSAWPYHHTGRSQPDDEWYHKDCKESNTFCTNTMGSRR